MFNTLRRGSHHFFSKKIFIFKKAYTEIKNIFAVKQI